MRVIKTLKQIVYDNKKIMEADTLDYPNPVAFFFCAYVF